MSAQVHNNRYPLESKMHIMQSRYLWDYKNFIKTNDLKENATGNSILKIEIPIQISYKI